LISVAQAVFGRWWLQKLMQRPIPHLGQRYDFLIVLLFFLPACVKEIGHTLA
jgi:hypothetical protein